MINTPLLLICALKEEARFFWNSPDPPVTVPEISPGLFTFHPKPGKAAHLLICGVGGERAGTSLNIVLESIRPAKVLIAGWSGALSDSVNLFDLVQVDMVHYWKSDPGDSLRFDPDLSARCRDFLSGQPLFHRSKTTVCSDIVIAKQDLKKQLREQYGAALVDMESYYLLTRLQGDGIPAAMVRVITDSADEQMGLDLEKLPASRAKKMAYLAAHPKQAAAYYRLLQDVKTATTRLAEMVPDLVKSLMS